MNIPLDRLYHYIESVSEKIYGGRVLIYRFFPYGSKNINDLSILVEIENSWLINRVCPLIWCNDQEPLDYEFYKVHHSLQSESLYANLLKSVGLCFSHKNLNYQRNIFEKNLLLHSEKRSVNVKKYQLDNAPLNQTRPQQERE